MPSMKVFLKRDAHQIANLGCPFPQLLTEHRSKMTDQQPADGRKSRKRKSRSKMGRKNPAASEGLKKKWQDPKYREKQTKHNQEVLPKGRRTRVGVPDGMDRLEALELWEQAAQKARHIMAEFEKAGVIKFEDTEEEQMAKACIREALVMALSPMRDQQIKIRAARIVLEWTRAKPVRQLELATAETWLREVLDNHQQP
jgi:hypothetical protein